MSFEQQIREAYRDNQDQRIMRINEAEKALAESRRIQGEWRPFRSRLRKQFLPRVRDLRKYAEKARNRKQIKRLRKEISRLESLHNLTWRSFSGLRLRFKIGFYASAVMVISAVWILLFLGGVFAVAYGLHRLFSFIGGAL